MRSTDAVLIVGVDVNPSREALARKLGMTHFVNPKDVKDVVGTIVEQLDENISLVEFSDEQGRAYAIAPCPLTELLTLHYVPEAA